MKILLEFNWLTLTTAIALAAAMILCFPEFDVRQSSEAIHDIDRSYQVAIRPVDEKKTRSVRIASMSFRAKREAMNRAEFHAQNLENLRLALVEN